MMIKKITLITALVSLFQFSNAQVVSDSVTLGSGYANQVFYQLSTGTKTSASNQDWDLQFFSSLFSASIRVNSGAGVELYYGNSTDTTNFATATIDTSSLTIMRDGYATWENDAFTTQQTGHPNYGWGSYQGLGNIVGFKVYIIKLSSGVLKKIWMNEFRTSGMLTFSVANLDGSGLVTKTLNRSTYSTKRHFYYDVENDAVLDSEPAKTSWELVFRTYSDMAGPQFYNVTGALSNYDLGISEARGIDVATAKTNFSTYTLDSAINVIGYDWKSFNNMTFQWNIEDSLSYIMKDYNGDVYQLIFTGTSGSSTGKMYFTKEAIAYASVNENSPVANLGVFPNPTTGVLNINFELINANQETSIVLMDVNGRIVRTISNGNSFQGFNQISEDISDLNQGVYFLIIQSGESLITKRIIKQ